MQWHSTDGIVARLPVSFSLLCRDKVMQEFEQMWEILNSPLFLLLFGFLFTTVAGTIITARYKRATHKQETRFTKLHEERARAIQALHEQIVDVEEVLFDLLYKWRPIGLFPPQVDPKDAANKVRELRRLSEKSAIYFRQDGYAVIDELCSTFETTWRNMEQAIMVASDPEREAPSFDEQAVEGVHITSREVRAKLQEEFRIILGVD
jgi:hypothetical protein